MSGAGNPNRASVGQRAQQLRDRMKLQSMSRAMRDLRDERADSAADQEEQFTRLLRDGVAEEVRSAVIEALRDIEQNRKLGRFSPSSDQAAREFETQSSVFVQKKELLEKIEQAIEAAREPYQGKAVPAGVQAKIDMLIQKAGPLREETLDSAEALLKLRRRIETLVRQDKRSADSLLETFRQCLLHLPPANRGKLDVQIQQRIKGVDIVTRIKVLNAIIQKLAMGIPSIAKSQVFRLLDEAREAARERRYKEALARLDQLFKFNKEHLEAHRLRADIYKRVGNVIAYKMELRMIVKIPDAEARDFYSLAQAIEETAPEEAHEFLEKTAQLDPRIKYIERWADSAFRLRRWHQAEGAYERIIAKKPNRAKTLHKLGVCYFETQQEEKALDVLRSAIQLSDDDPHSHVVLGRIYRSRKLADQAEEAFRKAISIDDSCHEAGYWLAAALFDRGEYAEAETVIQPVFEADPKRPRNRILLARCRAETGSVTDGIELLEETLAQDQVPMDVLMAYSDLCRRDGAIDKAIAAVEPVQKRYPRHPHLRNEYGMLLLAAGRFKEAGDFINPGVQLKSA